VEDSAADLLQTRAATNAPINQHATKTKRRDLHASEPTIKSSSPRIKKRKAGGRYSAQPKGGEMKGRDQDRGTARDGPEYTGRSWSFFWKRASLQGLGCPLPAPSGGPWAIAMSRHKVRKVSTDEGRVPPQRNNQ